MTWFLKSSALVLTCCMAQQVLVVTVAQVQRPRVAGESGGQAETTVAVMADGAGNPTKWSPALTGDRHPLYRLSKSDVIEVDFTFAPEFNQTITVRPDGFIALKGVDDLYAEGRTVTDLKQAIQAAYAVSTHDPEITIVLKEFDKPFFIASGQLAHPGKYELRGDATVTDAIAIAGGFNGQSKHSQVVLFRRVSGEQVEARVLDVKQMMKSRNLAEDLHLRPGDIVFVPQNMISKLQRYIPATTMSMYFNPTQF